MIVAAAAAVMGSIRKSGVRDSDANADVSAAKPEPTISARASNSHTIKRRRRVRRRFRKSSASGSWSPFRSPSSGIALAGAALSISLFKLEYPPLTRWSGGRMLAEATRDGELVFRFYFFPVSIFDSDLPKISAKTPLIFSSTGARRRDTTPCDAGHCWSVGYTEAAGAFDISMSRYLLRRHS